MTNAVTASDTARTSVQMGSVHRIAAKMACALVLVNIDEANSQAPRFDLSAAATKRLSRDIFPPLLTAAAFQELDQFIYLALPLSP
jgi:hypothetical protein